MKVIPTGGKMVTRTPINIHLINEQKDEKIELGIYQKGNWCSLKTLTYDMINFDNDIKNDIIRLTNDLTR